MKQDASGKNKIKKERFFMYLLSVLAVVLCFLLVDIFQHSVRFFEFFDMGSLLFLIVLIIPLMLSAGLLKDLNNAFGFIFGKKKAATLLMLKRAKLAVDTTMRAAVWGSVFVMVLQLIVLLHSMSDLTYLGPVISQSFLTLLYAMVICLLMVPIRAKLEQRILEYMPSCEEKEEEEMV